MRIWSRLAGVMGIVGLAVMAGACTSPAQVIPRAKNAPQTTTTLAETTVPPSVTSTSTEPSTTTTTVRVVAGSTEPAPLPPPQPPPTVAPSQPLPTQSPCHHRGHKNQENCSAGNQNGNDD
jgi:hypothetical protein